MKRKKRNTAVIACIGILGLLIGCISLFAAHSLQAVQKSQLAAERWDSDTVQVSCFLSNAAHLTGDGITSLRTAITDRLAQDSVQTCWYDAFSCDAGTVQVWGAKRVSKQLELTLISEHYFRIHAETILDGSCLSERDVSTMQVVLEEQAAWELFGAVNVSGMEVSFDNRICQVAGVVRVSQDFATQKMMEDALPQMFMLYEDYAVNAEEAPVITNYEAILPEPVQQYGVTLIQEIMPYVITNGDTASYRVIQNTDRFSAANVWRYFWDASDYTIRKEAVAYPFSENAALLLMHDIGKLVLLAATALSLSGIAALHLVFLYCRKLGNCVSRTVRLIKRVKIVKRSKEEEQ